MTEVCTQQLPAETVTALAGHAARIKEALQHGLMEVGRELTEAKALLGHGEFGAWVEREVGMTARTAQMILGAYRLCLKNEKFSLLGKSALYLLGAPNVPANTRAAIEAQIEAGDIPRHFEVKRIVHAATRVEHPNENAVNLAIRMEEPPTKAPVVDLHVYKVLSQTEAALADLDREGRKQHIQELRARGKVTDIAAMLDGILDSGQVFRLVTMIRNAPPDSTLEELADALEAI